MNCNIKDIEIKNINYFLCSDFKYSKNKNENLLLLEKVLKSNIVLNIKDHIFIELIKTSNNITCILKILKKYTNKKNLKKIKNLTKIFFHNYTVDIKEKIVKLLNDKQILNNLIISIKKNGFLLNENSPVVLCKHNEKLILIDGFHRFFVCRFLKLQKIKAEIYYV